MAENGDLFNGPAQAAPFQTHEIAASNSEEGFAVWYAEYPRKRGKADALKAWRTTARYRPPLREMLRVLAAQKRRPDWRRDCGQFIPYPASYLRAGMWDDDDAPPLAQTAPTEEIRCAFHRNERNRIWEAPRDDARCVVCCRIRKSDTMRYCVFHEDRKSSLFDPGPPSPQPSDVCPACRSLEQIASESEGEKWTFSHLTRSQ